MRLVVEREREIEKFKPDEYWTVAATLLKDKEFEAILIKKDGVEIPLATSGGFVELASNQMVILADTAERLEEIDEARAEEARSRVKQLMARKDSAEKVDFIALAAKMEKELARLKVARKYKNIKQGLQIKIEDE